MIVNRLNIFKTSLYLSIICKLYSSSYYSIDTSEIYKWKGAYPQSCICKENGATLATCSLFECTCLCDLTAAVCDYNCCCDPDCSSYQIARFKTLDVCSTEGIEGDTTTLCYSSSDLTKINPRVPLSGENTATQAVSEALCVVKTNYAFKNDYYTNIGLQSEAIFNTNNGQKTYSYIESQPLTYTRENYYDQNDTITAYYNISSNNILDLVASAAALPTSLVNNAISSITLTSVNYYDFTSNTLSTIDVDIFNSAGCNTELMTNYTYSNCSSPSLSSYEILTSNKACHSAVKRVDYVVYHDTSTYGKIINITAQVTIQDIPYQTTDALYSHFSQSFIVSFVSKSSDSKSSANGNLDYRIRSGNPGYIIGRPIVFGEGYFNITQSATTPVYILEYKSGLTYTSPVVKYSSSNSYNYGKGICPTSNDLNNLDYEAILFGYDRTSGCTIPLNREQLKSICLQGSNSGTFATSPYTSVSNGIPYLFNFTEGYVGIFGNADPLDASQWFLMTASYPVSDRIWNDALSTCYNMYSGIDYKFLIAKSSDKTNPQNKIVSATAAVTTTDWVLRVPYNNQHKTQNFQLTITVSFVYVDSQELKGYVPPAPPTLFKVPYDVFYPFQTGASNSFKEFNNLIGLISVVSLISVFLLY
eukprot:gene17563-23129_t